MFPHIRDIAVDRLGGRIYDSFRCDLHRFHEALLTTSEKLLFGEVDANAVISNGPLCRWQHT
jgi:hypothetical protein